MKSTELSNKQKGLMDEWKNLRTKIENEKREFTTEERTRINDIKLDLDNLDKEIAEEKVFEARFNAKLDETAKPVKEFGDFAIHNKSKEADAIRSTHADVLNLLKRGKEDKFEIPAEYWVARNLAKRGQTNATLYDGALDPTIVGPLSIINDVLFLTRFGARMTNDSGLNIKAPYASQVVASFGAEDTSIAITEQTNGSVTLSPAHVLGGNLVSGLQMKSASEASIARYVDDITASVGRAIEKRAVEHAVSTAANTISAFFAGSAATSGAITKSFFEATVEGEMALRGATGWALSRAAGSRARISKIDAGSGQLVAANGTINGIPYEATAFLESANANVAVVGDWSTCLMNIWGNINVGIMQDQAALQHGNFLLYADAFADGKVGNPNAYAKLTNTNLLGTDGRVSY